MIAIDQPTIFSGRALRVALSSVSDGSMKDGTELLAQNAIQNRTTLLERLGMPVKKAAIFAATFEGDEYCRYRIAESGVTLGVDALATDALYQPILLPLADCTGAVLYDPEHHAVMVSHLGRHSTEQYGGTRSVEYMAENFQTDPTKLLVWLSPSPNGDDYPLFKFENRSFNDVLLEQLQTAGVSRQNIEASTVDTIGNSHYFSHSEFLKGHRASDGRYAIVAMLI